MRTSHPVVQAKSDGECPTPTGCTVACSLRASSTICLHCRAEVGANTRDGRHSNVRAQFVKSANGEREGIEQASRAIRRSIVSHVDRSAVRSDDEANGASVSRSLAVGTALSAKAFAIFGEVEGWGRGMRERDC